ncbi:MAG TPA: MFS transporter [Thermomicrobiaceae bacterium]|nr:MFS transporter [Thermomicrobiaceae bacterium]
MRWGIVVAATAILAVAAGGRFMIGVVFDEVLKAFSLDHATLGAIVSISVLVVGAGQPAIGWLVDRLQARVVAAGGLACLGIGLVVTGRATTVWELVLGYCVFMALGLAAVSPVTITPLVSGWFVKRRATALSIVNAGGPLGQLAIVPGLTVLVTVIGWRYGFAALGVGLVVVGVPLILWLLRERDSSEVDEDVAFGCSTRVALGSRAFWQFGVGFFVCGFTMAWIMTYFVDYAVIHGISRETAGLGLSLMGGMSILGTLLTGAWTDRSHNSIPLAVVYALRGIGFAFLFVAGANPLFLAAALAVIGFSWSSTTPLTSALCADIYGRRALGTIFGLLYAIMPLGSAVGSALAGVLFDQTGSYTSSILINVAAGLIAAVTVATARSTPLFERQPVRESRPAPALGD